MKILFFADLHIFNHFSMTIFEDIAQKFLYDLLSYCKKNEIKRMVFLGDWFHLKNKIQVPSFIKSIDILKFFKKEGIEITFLIGNHDSPQADTNDFSILHSFTEFGTVIPLYDWEDIDGVRFHYLSYTKELPAFEMGTGSNILCAHLDVNNFMMEGNYVCTNGFEENQFSQFDYVISGHFHKHQVRGNIIFVGNPYQTRFSERYDDKGFIVFDTQDHGWKFIIYNEAPVFKEIDSEATDEKMIKGNFVRVRVSKDSDDLTEIKNRLLSMGAQDVDFVFENSSEQKELNIIEDLTMGSMKELAATYYDNIVESKAMPIDIQAYLDAKETTKDSVMAMFDEIENAFLTGWKLKEDE